MKRLPLYLMVSLLIEAGAAQAQQRITLDLNRVSAEELFRRVEAPDSTT
jgi:hypothetical protein